MVTATVSCEYCDWRETHRGVNPVELGVFVRKQLLQHMEEQHGEPIQIEIDFSKDVNNAAQKSDDGRTR